MHNIFQLSNLNEPYFKALFLYQKINFLTNLCETLCLEDLATSDTFLLWSYVLILIGGSVTPVLHLMTDEAVSSLGLDILRKKNCCMKMSWLRNTTSDRPGQEYNNDICNDEAL